jgi:predicted MFS family arabinose efflux permease
VLRVAPESPDTASALYVVSFQVGIGGGALIGSFLVGAGRLVQLPVVGLALAGLGTVMVLAARRAFPSIGGLTGPHTPTRQHRSAPRQGANAMP